MAPPPTTVVSPIISLAVRALTFICLLISLILLTTNTATMTLNFGGELRIRFKDVYAYRYMVAATVIGLAYTALQIVFTVFQVSTGNRLGGDALYIVDFFGDKVVSYLLATGVGAGFGVTIDLKSGFSENSTLDDFFNKATAAASILLIGFLFSAVSSVISSLSLPKRS